MEGGWDSKCDEASAVRRQNRRALAEGRVAPVGGVRAGSTVCGGYGQSGSPLEMESQDFAGPAQGSGLEVGILAHTRAVCDMPTREAARAGGTPSHPGQSSGDGVPASQPPDGAWLGAEGGLLVDYLTRWKIGTGALLPQPCPPAARSAPHIKKWAGGGPLDGCPRMLPLWHCWPGKGQVAGHTHAVGSGGGLGLAPRLGILMDGVVLAEPQLQPWPRPCRGLAPRRLCWACFIS